MPRGELLFPDEAGSRFSVAESTFLALAEEWREMLADMGEVRQHLHRSDLLSLSCLLISVEAGSQLSRQASRMIARCSRDVDKLPRSWPGDRLVWELCAAGMLKHPCRSNAVHSLIASLDHPRSQVRARMLDLGWTVRSWLTHPAAIYRLLTNLAYSHIYCDRAVVLANELCRGSASLDVLIADYPFCEDSTEDDFGRGYPASASRAERLLSEYRDLSKVELEAAAAELVKVECECRRLILAAAWRPLTR